MPEKECPDCHSLMAISIMTCPDCGHEFPQKPPHEEKATEINAMSEYKPPEEYPVVSVQYSKHEREGKTPSFRVDYYIDIYQKFSVWVCINHEGFAKRKALQWLQNVTVDEIESVDDALKYCDYFRKPSSIIVDENNEYPNVLGYLFEQDLPPSRKEFEREQEAAKRLEQDKHIESLMF
jgi:DNA repair protein RadD